ncbi:MAG TPA: MFS transporter [Saprospiraceae bacterium]|nr:MFS transporter [Saprospiraceae bacterium]
MGNYRWTICALLFFATTINYLDRQVLSLLKPTLEEEFGWTNSQYANIAASFQMVYAIAMLFAGRIIDMLGTKKGYAWAIIIWSVGAIIHAWAIPIGETLLFVLGWIGIFTIPVSVLGFIFSRVVLAIGEAGNFPAAIKAIAEYFPRKERSFATGIFNSGANVGAILAPLSVPWIDANWGWQSAFIIVGSVGFIWLLFWMYFYEKPLDQKRLSTEELEYIMSGDEDLLHIIDPPDRSEKISWIKLLRFRQTWSFVTGKFITDGVWWFFLFWLPAYLYDQYNLEKTELVMPLAILYSLTMFGSIGGGWFPVYFIHKGYGVYQARMKAMIAIAVIPLIVLVAQPLGHISYWLPVIIIGIGASAHQAWSANLFTTVSDLFPKKTIASVVGIGGMAGGIGGVLTTKAGGALFDHYKGLGTIETGYTIMFTFCAVAYVLAWALMKALVPKYRPINEI